MGDRKKREKDVIEKNAKNTAYHTHISNALFQNIFLTAYLSFLSKTIIKWK